MYAEPVEWMIDYFIIIATDIVSNPDDGSLLDAFRPALDLVSSKLKGITLDDRQLLDLVDVVSIFTRNNHLAEVRCALLYLNNTKFVGLLLVSYIFIQTVGKRKSQTEIQNVIL